VTSDLLGSAAAIAAALVIMATGWTPIDPILSVAITLLILRSAWLITKDAGHILLEAAPSGLDVREIERDLEAAIPDVRSIHHVHAWSLTEDRKLLTLHAQVCDTTPPEQVASAIKARLKQRFGIAHATVEIEHGDCADRDCGPGCGDAAAPAASRTV
jgi:cobalt-zinc-cadmium efflux system protein